jgi:hypothetical protein
MEFSSATKKNEILSFSGKWLELENIILHEVSQTQKTKSCMFFPMYNIVLIYTQQYETIVTLRRGHSWKGVR